MFSVYSEIKYMAEPIEVIYPNGVTIVYPDLSDYTMKVALSDITEKVVGISLEADKVCFPGFNMFCHAMMQHHCFSFHNNYYQLVSNNYDNCDNNVLFCYHKIKSCF